MGSCRIEKSQQGFKILGLMNFHTVSCLYKDSLPLFADYKEVRLDFAEVVHADSSAIALLLNWLRYAKKNRKQCIFTNLPSQLCDIANVCEVLPILENSINHNQ